MYFLNQEQINNLINLLKNLLLELVFEPTGKGVVLHYTEIYAVSSSLLIFYYLIFLIILIKMVFFPFGLRLHLTLYGIKISNVVTYTIKYIKLFKNILKIFFFISLLIICFFVSPVDVIPIFNMVCYAEEQNLTTINFVPEKSIKILDDNTLVNNMFSPKNIAIGVAVLLATGATFYCIKYGSSDMAVGLKNHGHGFFNNNHKENTDPTIEKPETTGRKPDLSTDTLKGNTNNFIQNELPTEKIEPSNNKPIEKDPGSIDDKKVKEIGKKIEKKLLTQYNMVAFLGDRQKLITDLNNRDNMFAFLDKIYSPNVRMTLEEHITFLLKKLTLESELINFKRLTLFNDGQYLPGYLLSPVHFYISLLSAGYDTHNQFEFLKLYTDLSLREMNVLVEKPGENSYDGEMIKYIDAYLCEKLGAPAAVLLQQPHTLLDLLCVKTNCYGTHKDLDWLPTYLANPLSNAGACCTHCLDYYAFSIELDLAIMKKSINDLETVLDEKRVFDESNPSKISISFASQNFAIQKLKADHVIKEFGNYNLFGQEGNVNRGRLFLSLVQVQNCEGEVGLVQHTKFLNLSGPDQSQSILNIAKNLPASLRVEINDLREVNKFFFKIGEWKN